MKPIKEKVSQCFAHVAGFAYNVEADVFHVFSAFPLLGATWYIGNIMYVQLVVYRSNTTLIPLFCLSIPAAL